MNIYALPGHKVKVTERTKNNGYSGYDTRLELEKEYTVDHTVVHRSSTDVFLVEFPADAKRPMGFNSVNFEDVVPQSDEDSKKHPDWIKYHGGRSRFYY